MSFESLSERYEFLIADFPGEWLPLTHLYDPDLPLFPLQYFHLLDPELEAPNRPRHSDRVFGFIHHLNLTDDGLTVSLVLNKDLSLARNGKYRPLVECEIRARLGLGDPVRLAAISGHLTGELSDANGVVSELWYQVVDGSFGKSLPFGRMWDGVFGLARFVASWNSEGGRKGELIQTHYFAAAFGERIGTGQGVHADFYLLPTFAELTDTTNPLSIFPRYAALTTAATSFVDRFCAVRCLRDGSKFSAFELQSTGVPGNRLDTKAILQIMGSNFSGSQREALFENYNAFNRGPHRCVISLMMLHDLRHGMWSPLALTPNACGEMYVALKGSYQTPKVIQLYAQQCFGSECVLPIDNWVETFLRWPLAFDASRRYYERLFECSSVWGKIERLIWMASQARKVHSSVAAEILWCVRYGGPNKLMRGANPLSCKICEVHVRSSCPAYRKIESWDVVFNAPVLGEGFALTTSDGDSRSPAQSFVRCSGADTEDEYSPRDRPLKFLAYPASPHAGEKLSVKEFIAKY